jgi:hypothetical protein
MGFHGLLVEAFGLAIFDDDGILGAMTEAGAQAVAKVFGSQSGFTVDDFYGPFGTGGDAEAATVAFFFVYFYDFTHHAVRISCVKKDNARAGRTALGK